MISDTVAVNASLLGTVAKRLAEHPVTVAGAADLVVAAFRGEETFAATLGGATLPAATAHTSRASAASSTYLRSIEVEGFRGIGPPVVLELRPGPGLTLVVGRNGSGKSSLAEALEMLLTGSNRRWLGRSAIWVEGWRNLHHRPPRITARFAVDGRATPLTVRREWTGNAEITASVLTVDGKRRTLEESGWQQALTSYPPLLSHNELGRILEGKPTELYDALASILGLGDIAAAEALLRRSRLDAETAVKAAQRSADDIVAQLDVIDDERAVAIKSALSARAWDLAAVESVVAAGGLVAVEQRTELGTLRALSSLPVLDRATLRRAGERLREVGEEISRLGGSDAANARDTALLLEQALTVHAPHATLDCPVCGTAGVLTYEWRLRTAERIEQLREEAAAVESVHRRADAVRVDSRQLITPVPNALHEAATVAVDAQLALSQWERWWALPSGCTLAALSVHLDTVGPELIAAVAQVRAAAGAELERREDRWRPALQALTVWLPAARDAVARSAALPRLKAAEQWMRDAHQALRRDRFEPIAEQVQANWCELRQNSSVALGELRLEGTATASNRRLTLDATIDGDGASALGVMSQGELNCLALSLFLPRASMPESPFRFMVIDDPVQAMDPVKVEGLARVLARAAAQRQVIVLTHDDRLPDAVRRLAMDATIVEVSRREQSVVDLRRVLDPVQRHIDDAMAVAQTERLPVEARRVVPGFCRMALEAACAQAVTDRLLDQGRSHADIESALSAATTLKMWLAAAVLRDPTRSGEVQPWLERNLPWSAPVVRLVNRGTHMAITADMVDLVRSAERLCRWIGAGAHLGD
jgi:energy-coupling factor transporter ATP-binding protein EcfA2